MLYPEKFWSIYGRGAKIYDATGRELRCVMACNPETGEVIRWAQGAFHPLDWIRWRLRRVKPRLKWDWLYSGSIHTRHGFWPAPFTVVPPDDQ